MKFIVFFLDLAKGIGCYLVGKINFLLLEISLVFWPLGMLPLREMDGNGRKKLRSVLNQVHNYLGP